MTTRMAVDISHDMLNDIGDLLKGISVKVYMRKPVSLACFGHLVTFSFDSRGDNEIRIQISEVTQDNH